MHVDHQPSKPTMPALRFAIGENVARTMSSREMSELTGKRHDSVKRTASGVSFGNQGFRPLKAWCQKHGVTAAKVPCPRYGQAVSWPAAAWSEVYGVELGALFGAGADA